MTTETPTQAQLARQMTEVIQRFQTFIKQQKDWLAGTPDGGPSADGLYPLTDFTGTTHFVPCPALDSARVTGNVNSASAFSAQATVAMEGAQTFLTQSTLARDAANGFAQAAVAARDLAENYANTAGSYAAQAREYASDAAASASAAAQSAIDATQDLQALADAVSAAGASQVAAKASQVAAKTSETNAKASATASAGSATAAASSASGAATARTDADASKRAAADSALASAASSTKAADSASAASSSASNAVASLSAARQSAADADLSATQANDSRNKALDSQVAAAASAATAQTKATSSMTWANRSQAWAEADTGVLVEGAGYSAKHWAVQAQNTLAGALVYKGTWSASTKAYPTGAAVGHLYKVSAAGTAGGVSYAVGDQIIFNGTDWDKIDNTDQVTSVAGRQGAVALTSGDIGGLGTLATKSSVDFASDIVNLPATFPSSSHTHTKGDVGLSNVDNTADSAKPVSVAQQAALNAKLDKAGGSVGALTTLDSYTVLNPKSSTAKVSLEYVDDKPRLRVGGTGTTADAPFAIQGVGDFTRLSLDSNGNATFGGPNMTAGGKQVWHAGNFAPATKADINSPQFTGNIGVSGGNFIGGTSYALLAPAVGGNVIYLRPGGSGVRTGELKLEAGQMVWNNQHLVWHAGNLNPADKLDRAGGIMTGVIQFSQGSALRFNSTTPTYFQGPEGAGDNVINFTRRAKNDYQVNIFGGLSLNGESVWHTGNLKPSDYAKAADVASKFTDVSASLDGKVGWGGSSLGTDGKPPAAFFTDVDQQLAFKYSNNTTGSNGYPTQFGATLSVIMGRQNARSFDFHTTTSGSNLLYFRGYSSTSVPSAWRRVAFADEAVDYTTQANTWTSKQTFAGEGISGLWNLRGTTAAASSSGLGKWCRIFTASRVYSTSNSDYTSRITLVGAEGTGLDSIIEFDVKLRGSSALGGVFVTSSPSFDVTDRLKLVVLDDGVSSGTSGNIIMELWFQSPTNYLAWRVFEGHSYQRGINWNVVWDSGQTWGATYSTGKVLPTNGPSYGGVSTLPSSLLDLANTWNAKQTLPLGAALATDALLELGTGGATLRGNSSGAAVLAGGGDAVYLRPNGNTSGTGQVQLASNGRMALSGNLALPSDKLIEMGSAGGSIRGTSTGSVVLSSGSGSSGYVYLRPNGDTSESGQFVVYANGVAAMASGQAGTPGDGNVLLELRSERSWQFKQVNTAGNTLLQLLDTTGAKEFQMKSVTNDNVIRFLPHSSRILASEFTGSLVGNAATATRATLADKLTAARTINGTNFDGSTGITTATWGTARSITIGKTAKSVNGSGNVSWTLAELGAADASHGHAIADVSGLQAALDKKANGDALGWNGASPANNDWNNALSTGWFMASDASNAPTGGWFMGMVHVHNNEWVQQEIWAFTEFPTRRYRRSKLNGSWSGWQQVGEVVVSSSDPGGPDGTVWIQT